MSPVQEDQKTVSQGIKSSLRLRDSNFIQDLAALLSNDDPDSRFAPLARIYRYSAPDFCDLVLAMKLPKDEALRIMGGDVLKAGELLAGIAEDEIRQRLETRARESGLKCSHNKELYEKTPHIEQIMSAIDRHYTPLVAGRRFEHSSITRNITTRAEQIIRDFGRLADDSSVSGHSLLHRAWKALEGTERLEEAITERYQNECNLKDTRAFIAGSLQRYRKALARPESHEMMPLFFAERAEILETLSTDPDLCRSAKKLDIERSQALRILKSAGVSGVEEVLEKVAVDTHRERRSDLLLTTALRQTEKQLKNAIIERLKRWQLDESCLKWDEVSSSWRIDLPERRKGGFLLEETREEQLYSHMPRGSEEHISVSPDGCIVRASEEFDSVAVSFIDHKQVSKVTRLLGRWIGNDNELPGSVTIINMGTKHVVSRIRPVFSEHIDTESVLLEGNSSITVWNREFGPGGDTVHRADEKNSCSYRAGSRSFPRDNVRALQVSGMHGLRKKDGTEIIAVNLFNGACEILTFDGNSIKVLGAIHSQVEKVVEGPSGDVLLRPYIGKSQYCYTVSPAGELKEHFFNSPIYFPAILKDGSVLAALRSEADANYGFTYSFWHYKEDGSFSRSHHPYNQVMPGRRLPNPSAPVFMAGRSEGGQEKWDLVSHSGNYICDCPNPGGLVPESFQAHTIDGNAVCIFHHNHLIFITNQYGDTLQGISCPGDVKQVFNTDNGIAAVTEEKVIFYESLPEGKKTGLSLEEKKLLELLNIVSSRNPGKALQWSREHPETHDNRSSPFLDERITELTEKHPASFLDFLRADVRNVGAEKLERLFRLWYPEKPKEKRNDQPGKGQDRLAPEKSTYVNGGDPLQKKGTALLEIDGGYQGFLATDLYFEWGKDGIWHQGGLRLGKNEEDSARKISYRLPRAKAGDISLPLPPGGKVEMAELETRRRRLLFFRTRGITRPELQVDPSGMTSTALNAGGALSCRVTAPAIKPLPDTSAESYNDLLNSPGFTIENKENEPLNDEDKSGNPLVRAVHPLPTEALIKIREIADLPPARKAYEIAMWLRQVGYYDRENGETLEDKDDAAPCSRFQYMRERAITLLEKNPCEMEGKLFAGVCADYAVLGSAMMRKAGIAAGVATGFLVNGPVVSPGDRHAVAVALLSADRDGRPLPWFLDCTPGGEPGAQPTNIELPPTDKASGEEALYMDEETASDVEDLDLSESSAVKPDGQAASGGRGYLPSLAPVDELVDTITGVFRTCYISQGSEGWTKEFQWYLPAPKLFVSDKTPEPALVKEQLQRFLNRERDSLDPDPAEEYKMLKQAFTMARDYGAGAKNQQLIEAAAYALALLNRE